MKFRLLLISCLMFSFTAAQAQKEKQHTFAIDSVHFLLDGKPFQIISGEMHYARIPHEYWRHRIQMAKALGCNTIATYVFWNYHETKEGVFDFKTENRNLAEYLRIAKEEGMWVLLRPGPYVCAEWDLGGIPPYLLSIPDIKLRCMDPRYMAAVERYVQNLSAVVKPYLITNGGPVIMVQVENEYGSYGNDRNYMHAMKNLWVAQGIDVPFYTSDGATTYMLEAGSLPGCAVGLDPCGNMDDYKLARKMNPGVPVFGSEIYPGWLTHWGEEWQRPDTNDLMEQVRFLLYNKISFSLYVLHGGTNFGFYAGANSGGSGYQPDVTSYDYDSPINEQGQPTPKYFTLQKEILKYKSTKGKQFKMPVPIPAMEIPEIALTEFTSVWNELPEPVSSVQPKPFESYNLYYGFALYKTTLIGHKSGNLTITDLHDYATIFLDGKFVGTIDRSKGENSIKLPASDSKNPVLEIFVEGMGRINFAQQLIDRKGITKRVTLNGMTLMNWEVYCLPMDPAFIAGLEKSSGTNREGKFFKGTFSLDKTADTFIDMSHYLKGVVWVNGHNLGRYWNIGPQQRLYCPAPFLKEGVNEILVFDLLQLEAMPVWGTNSLIAE